MTRNLFGHRTLNDVVREALESLGGRANKEDIFQRVRDTMTLSEFEAWSATALRQAVRNAVTSRVTAAGTEAVYATGDEFAPLRLFSYEEIEDKARSLARQSQAMRGAVFALARACFEVHRKTFDAEAILAEAAGQAEGP